MINEKQLQELFKDATTAQDFIEIFEANQGLQDEILALAKEKGIDVSEKRELTDLELEIVTGGVDLKKGVMATLASLVIAASIAGPLAGTAHAQAATSQYQSAPIEYTMDKNQSAQLNGSSATDEAQVQAEEQSQAQAQEHTKAKAQAEAEVFATAMAEYMEDYQDLVKAIERIQGEALEKTRAASDAQEKAEEKAQEARKAVEIAQKQAYEAQEEVQEAQVKADEAQKEAQEAQKQADEAQKEAQEAQVKADEAQEVGDEAQKEVQEVQEQAQKAQAKINEALAIGLVESEKTCK